MNNTTNKQKVLLVASFGGHFKQLMRIKSLLDEEKFEFVCISTNPELVASGQCQGHIVDVNADKIWQMLLCFPKCIRLLMKLNPKYVISTGALPGLCMVIAARLLGKKTIWVDSIANYSTLSKSGRYARRWANLWCTQWEHLAAEQDKLIYIGKVL